MRTRFAWLGSAARSGAIILATALTAAAHGQDTASITARVERAPWGRPIAVIDCDGRIVVSGSAGIFASADARRWTREGGVEGRILEFACIDGALYGIGRPGLIARREHDGSWREEHSVEDRPEWNRSAEFSAIWRDGSRLVAAGYDGAGEPIQVTRDDAGRWRNEPSRALRRSPPNECGLRPRRTRIASRQAIRRVLLCPWGAPTRVLIWAEHANGGPDRVAALPRRIEGSWHLAGVAGQSVFVIRGFADDEVSDEITHHEIARLEGGHWATLTVEDPQMWRGLVERENELLLFGAGRLYRIDVTTGR